MAYYEYVEMNNMQSEDTVVLENICLLLNEKWDYEEIEETKKMIKMFEDSEEIMDKIMSIKEIDVRNRKALTFLTLTEDEKRLGMIEDPEKWIADLNLRMDEQRSDPLAFFGGLDDTTVEMVKALAKFFLKIAVYRFCTVHWHKLLRPDQTIDKKRIKTLQKELEHWEFCFWIVVGGSGIERDMFEERERLISRYDVRHSGYGFFDRSTNIVQGWIEEAFQDSKDKVIYEKAKKLRRDYIEESRVVKKKDERGDRKILEIEKMRKLLDIMERHLSNNLTPQDIADLKENMQDWEKNAEKLSEMIGNLSDFKTS